MSPYFVFSLLIVLMVFGHLVGQRRAAQTVGGDSRDLHSLPQFHGMFVALWTGIPAAALLILWIVLQPYLLDELVIASLAEQARNLSSDQLGLLLNDIRNVADGNISSRRDDPVVLEAAKRLVEWRQIGNAGLLVVILAFALAGLTLARRRIAPNMRARVAVERVFNVFLFVASLIAI